MIAIKRLKNILWILIVAFGALTAYLISLRVATERNAVQALDGKIFHVRADIRYLETEFESRANMRQLEKWNSADYRYGAPQAAQYLPDERALASLDGVKSNGEIYVAPPVMMAMADSAAPVTEAVAQRTQSPANEQIRDDDSMLRVASAKVQAPVAAAMSVSAPVSAPVREAAQGGQRKATTRPDAARAAPVRTAQASVPAATASRPAPDPVARKAARMALLDAQLLDDRTLRDLGAKAAVESGPKRR
ncbi:colicin transporter [Sphingobium sufflavum]|uniref:colicin transporter n=1 Tax=Sphingobium sufflavum TaxID=1129547 RepID=UPI001F3DCE9F|nr:colicin transporter [Sphingobium sufflavum]MCE7795869.1 colicin transporter [Sphingobium sufflavum]